MSSGLTHQRQLHNARPGRCAPGCEVTGLLQCSRKMCIASPTLSFTQQIGALHLWAGTDRGPRDQGGTGRTSLADAGGNREESLSLQAASAVRGTLRAGVGTSPRGWCRREGPGGTLTRLLSTPLPEGGCKQNGAQLTSKV